MQSRPRDLPDDAVATAVSAGWKLPPTTAVYQPVGNGSHHWLIESAAGKRWFASVDHLAEQDRQSSFDRLEATLSAAVVARQSGLSFIVAPTPRPAGAVLHGLRDTYAVALYPFVVGRSGECGDRLPAAEAEELTSMLCSLHSVPIATGATTNTGLAVDSFTVPGWKHVDKALTELHDSEGWPAPYGEPPRTASRSGGCSSRAPPMLNAPGGGTVSWSPQRDHSAIGWSSPTANRIRAT